MLKNAKTDTTRCKLINTIIELSIDSVWPRYNLTMKALCETKLAIIPSNHPEYRFYKKYYGTSLFNLGWYEKDFGSWENAILYYRKSMKIMEEIKDQSRLFETMNNIAVIHNEYGNTAIALEYYEKCLAQSIKEKNHENISTMYNNMGRVYHNRGNILKAIEFYNKGLKLKEQTGDISGVAVLLNNLGHVYSEQSDFTAAIDYYNKSLKIMTELKDKKGMASTYNNFAVLYSTRGDLDKSAEYLKKALKLQEELNNKEGMARVMNNLGSTLAKKDDFETGLDYMTKALKIREEIRDKRGIATSLNSIGGLLIANAEEEKNTAEKEKKIRKALKYCTEALKMAEDIKAPYLTRPSSFNLFKIYKSLGDHKNALTNYKLFIMMRDSMSNEETRKAGIKAQLKYEYEKQSAQDSVAHAKETEIKNAQLDGQKVEIKAKKNQQLALYGGLILVIAFAGIMYNRFKIAQKQKIIIEAKEKETQKQNEIITEQKHLVEEKQKEILDSIKYARRIQTALITNEKYITKTINRLKN